MANLSLLIFAFGLIACVVADVSIEKTGDGSVSFLSG